MDHLLLFQLEDAPYALELGHIQEVVESPALNYIPRAPAAYKGAINVHGRIIAVLDLVAHLGYSGEGRDHRLIVLPSEICGVALSVSAVGRIVFCDTKDHLPSLERRGRDSFSRAQFERDGIFVNILDISRLVASLQERAEWLKKSS